MSEVQTTGSTGGVAPPGATAGAMLIAAREASGLSIDAVAQQLKLAPRQVRALEQGDFGLLPGRTFVRGFVRNYARLVRLDPEHVLEALPGGATSTALEAPTLHSTARAMGELPTAEPTKAGWTRWAIPLTLVVVVAAAAAYEWARPPGSSRSPPVAKEATTEAPLTPATTGKSGDKVETQLPNPLAMPPTTPSASDRAGGSSSTSAPAQGSAAAEKKGAAKAP